MAIELHQHELVKAEKVGESELGVCVCVLSSPEPTQERYAPKKG